MDLIVSQWDFITKILFAPWLALITVPLGLGLIWWSNRRKSESDEERPQVASPKPLAASGSSIEFFNKRPDLQWLLGKVRNSRICWGAWFVGGSTSTANIIDQGRFERLVLLHPDHKALGIFKKIQPSFEAERLAQLIRGLTNDAQKKGEVRWCPDILYSLLTIGNPPTGDLREIPSDCWIFVEVYVPGINAFERPSFYSTFAKEPDLCRNMLAAFDSLWSYSAKPD